MNPLTKIDIDKCAKEINGAFRKGIAQAVEGFIETGRMLLDLRPDKKNPKPGQLPWGSFQTMVETKLDFTPRTAQYLMTVAAHPVLSKAKHVSHLPPSWGTLAQLARVHETKLLKAIADGTVNPGMEREDVKALLPKKKAKPEPEDEPEEERKRERSSPLANGEKAASQMMPPTTTHAESEALAMQHNKPQSPSPTALPAPGVTIDKSFTTRTLQQIDALGLGAWDEEKLHWGSDIDLDLYDAIVRVADVLQKIHYGMEDVLDAPLTARRKEQQAADVAEWKRKAEADEVARLARIEWEITHGDEARRRYYDEALAEANIILIDQAEFDASYKPDTNGQVGIHNPEYGFFERWYKEHNTIWPGHRDEPPPKWDRSRRVTLPEVNINHVDIERARKLPVDIEKARKLLDAFDDQGDPQGYHRARIALAKFLKIKPPTPPVPPCDYSIDPIDAASGERGLADQEWDAVNAEYLAAEYALEEKIWRIDYPKEAAEADREEAERAAATKKRLIAEANSPEKAKAKALKDAKHDAMADAMDSAKADARENQERWGDLKDEWLEEWEANNWQPEQIAEAEASFAECWEREHGKAFPASRSAVP